MRQTGLIVCVLVFLLCSAWSTLAADCAAGKGQTMIAEGNSRGLKAFITTDPAPIAVGQPFRATVSICGADPLMIDRFEIDATMPRHRHGMNYTPKVTADEKQIYAVTGLFFHMPGLWRFNVIVRANKERQQFTHDVVVE